jgi:hypothetical protein
VINDLHTATDLWELLSRRASEETVVGGFLGTEGSHALDNKKNNLTVSH